MRVTWSAIALLGLSCISMARYAPLRERVPEGVTDDQLWTAALRIVSEQGLTVRDKDRDAGYFATEWLEASEDGLFTKTVTVVAWRVTIGEGMLGIALDCQVQSGSTRSQCAPDRRPGAWVSRMGAFADAIMRDARKLAAAPRNK